MNTTLSSQELKLLIQRVFQPTEQDRGLAIIVDLPDGRLADNEDWAERRRLAAGWYLALQEKIAELGLPRLTLAWYRNAGGNNADLPELCHPGDGLTVPDHADAVAGTASIPFTRLFAEHSLVLAPTELSATAPLKVATRQAGSGPDGFRAATMPGFLPSMVPALRLDYELINRRVNQLKDWLDQAERADFRFTVDDRTFELALDLRHRAGHASGGLFPANGIAGNLPSGEAYIVPYEGEIEGDASASRGTLPVQIGEEVVVYRIEGNKAVAVISEGPVSRQEAGRIADEPAYANLAELGLGVLGDFDLKPTGSILLDEKLGLHIAFGRSDHFGGTVGPADFSGPDAVIHLDRVYIPETQPQVLATEVRLAGPGLDRVIIRDGVFLGLD
jgi:aminopeptidase